MNFFPPSVDHFKTVSSGFLRGKIWNCLIFVPSICLKQMHITEIFLLYIKWLRLPVIF